MLFSEDLRGREFRWHTDGGPKIAVSEDGLEVVHLLRSGDQARSYFAAFGDQRIQIDYSMTPVGPSFSVTDPDRNLLTASSHYESDLSLHARFGTHTYALRRGLQSTTWQDGTGDVLSFRPNGALYVLMGASPNDAPALLLLGAVMAAEQALFSIP